MDSVAQRIVLLGSAETTGTWNGMENTLGYNLHMQIVGLDGAHQDGLIPLGFDISDNAWRWQLLDLRGNRAVMLHEVTNRTDVYDIVISAAGGSGPTTLVRHDLGGGQEDPYTYGQLRFSHETPDGHFVMTRTRTLVEFPASGGFVIREEHVEALQFHGATGALMARRTIYTSDTPGGYLGEVKTVALDNGQFLPLYADWSYLDGRVINADLSPNGASGEMTLGAGPSRLSADAVRLADGRVAVAWDYDVSPTADPVLRFVTISRAGHDFLVAGSGGERLDGMAGNDTLVGGAGRDTLAGGAGNDRHVVTAAEDRVVEFAAGGLDTVASASISLALGTYAHVEALLLLGSEALNLTGNAGANRLTGNAGANRLNGGAGADTMAGGAGNDVFVLHDTGDRVIELAQGGRDEIVSSAISLNLAGFAHVEVARLAGTAALAANGSARADTLFGNAGANRLNGGAGADTLSGGAGADTLTGGLGADVFQFVSSTASRGDRIADFTPREDRINLSSFMPEGTFIGAAAFAGLAGQVRYDRMTGRLIGDLDGDRTADWIVTLTNKAALSDRDVIF